MRGGIGEGAWISCNGGGLLSSSTARTGIDGAFGPFSVSAVRDRFVEPKNWYAWLAVDAPGWTPLDLKSLRVPLRDGIATAIEWSVVLQPSTSVRGIVADKSGTFGSSEEFVGEFGLGQFGK